MAKGSYISKNLSKNQLEFMLRLDEYEMDIFSLDEIKKMFPDQSEKINEIIENLVHKGIFSRIERGKYVRSSFRDEKVIGCYLVLDGAIAYWSALNLHGLTEQFSNAIFIQTAKVKQDKEVFGVNYKFVTIANSKRDGIQKAGYGNHSYRITDQEKTISDCFDQPKYAGGYAELIRALEKAKLSSQKMIRYAKAIQNTAATKRMGYLAELFKKEELRSFIEFAKQQVRESYNPIDPFGADRGEYIREWRLRLNISRDELSGIVNGKQN